MRCEAAAIMAVARARTARVQKQGGAARPTGSDVFAPALPMSKHLTLAAIDVELQIFVWVLIGIHVLAVVSRRSLREPWGSGMRSPA